MIVSALWSNMLTPIGTGTTLSPAVGASRTQSTSEPQPLQPVTTIRHCTCGQADCAVCGTSEFDIKDTVELTAVPLGDQAEASVDASELTDEQQAQVEELQESDRQVRAHERAHSAAAGQYAVGGASFEYQTGPDGKRYAIGGEVQIDTTPIAGDPEATIRKMQQVQAAAMAPADPSAQDRAVASRAAAAVRSARTELAEQKAAEDAADSEEPDSSGDAAQRPGNDTVTDPRFQSERYPASVLVDTYA